MVNDNELAGEIMQQWIKLKDGDEVDNSIIRPIIANSWHRSVEFGITPYDQKVEVLSHNNLQTRIIQENDWFLKIAQDKMNQLYKLVAGTGFMITLGDENGYLIKVIGDSEAIKEAEKITLVLGSNWSERRMGTSGLGLCLALKQPVQIRSVEHYVKMCHTWTCAAAPLFDSNGNLLGALNMSADFKKYHPHTFGMIVTAAQAIYHELENRKAQVYLDISKEYLKTVLDTVSDGIISVNQEGVVNYINTAARQILNSSIDNEKPLPKDASSCLGIDSALTLGQHIANKEIDIKPTVGQGKLMITVHPVRSQDSIVGAITALRRVNNGASKNKSPVGTGTCFTFQNILGVSESIKDTIRLARDAAHYTSNILLIGESGTGKEMFAQAIHNASNRSENPFIAINCAAIPRELIGSELFGYNDGAFTGARRAGSPGKFELADDGTIFLDEIEDMPLEQQPALLRVLEEKQVTRIGGQHSTPIDVRTIAATNQDLLKKVNEKSFRPDLYYRLNVLCIKIPPLRERKGDITFLAEYFLHKFNQELNMNAYFSRNVLNSMESYAWPGNVRELQNVVQQSMFLSGGGTIMPEHLHINDISGDITSSDQKSLKWKDSQLDSIVKTLEQTRGDVVQAAHILGISRTTIYRKLKEMNPNPKETTKYQHTK